MHQQEPFPTDGGQQQRAGEIVHFAAMLFGFFGEFMPQDGEYLLPDGLGILTFLILSKPVRGQAVWTTRSAPKCDSRAEPAPSDSAMTCTLFLFSRKVLS